MSLSCFCPEYCDPIWWYISPINYGILTRSKRQRCKSCDKLIDIGAICIEFERWRNPISNVEENIYGEGGEIPIASWYMCEECSDIYFNLEELGFCIQLGDSMQELLKEYRDLYSHASNTNSSKI
jgi:hypothetical protein